MIGLIVNLVITLIILVPIFSSLFYLILNYTHEEDISSVKSDQRTNFVEETHEVERLHYKSLPKKQKGFFIRFNILAILFILVVYFEFLAWDNLWTAVKLKPNLGLVYLLISGLSVLFLLVTVNFGYVVPILLNKNNLSNSLTETSDDKLKSSFYSFLSKTEHLVFMLTGVIGFLFSISSQILLWGFIFS